MKIAVTGNMGAGKSTLARLLVEVSGGGALLVDADAVSRLVVEESAPLRRRLAAAFGEDLVDAEARLDRRALARRALADDVGRRHLEALVRPFLEPRLEAALAAAAAQAEVVVFDAPLVFEWGIEDWFDRIVVVISDTDIAAQRVAAERGLGLDEVRQRRARQRRQPPADSRVLCVDNNGSIDDLRHTAIRLWKTLNREHP